MFQAPFNQSHVPSRLSNGGVLWRQPRPKCQRVWQACWLVLRGGPEAWAPLVPHLWWVLSWFKAGCTFAPTYAWSATPLPCPGMIAFPCPGDTQSAEPCVRTGTPQQVWWGDHALLVSPLGAVTHVLVQCHRTAFPKWCLIPTEGSRLTRSKGFVTEPMVCTSASPNA